MKSIFRGLTRVNSTAINKLSNNVGFQSLLSAKYSQAHHGDDVELIEPPSIDISNTKLFIGGKYVDSMSGKIMPTIDPRTAEPITFVSEAQSEDVDIAVECAHKAYKTGVWSRMSGSDRGKILTKIADLINENFSTLQHLETWDGGKPLSSSAVDIWYTEETFRYYAGLCDKIHGQTIQCNNVPFEKFAYTLHEPYGVIGCIIPWNFPLLIGAWYLAPALACGNSVIIKPSQHTPLSMLYLAKLMSDAGIPDGIINVLTGKGSNIGNALTLHPKISKIGFTGSTEIGRTIMTNCAQNLIPVTLELGGKSPLIICNDANLDIAIEASDIGLFLNQGQVCAASSRIYVQSNIYDKFIDKMLSKIKTKQIGDPFKQDTTHGPQQNETQFNKILDYINIGKKEGANLLCGGNRIGNIGYYIEPTLFTDVKDNMIIAKDEIFGPVMSILKFDDINEVIEKANQSNYGLSAGVISDNINTINHITRGLEAGTVWVNCYNLIDSSVPFGGYKHSGFGKVKGQYALENFYRTKSVIQMLPNNGGWY